MNCPKCNKEVSPDWKLCPFCGYEPKKCSNPECPPRWLPNDAKFCPECGKMLEETSILPIPKVKEENRNVSIGDILCTDNTTVPSSAWPVAGKKALGVVFYVDMTGVHGCAVNLWDFNNGENVKWCDIEEKTSSHCYQTTESAIRNMMGASETRQIRKNNALTGNYPIANTVDYDNGWYLPSCGQLKLLIDNITVINNSIRAIRGTEFLGFYWSSTQCDEKNAWIVHNAGLVTTNWKITKVKVRSIRSF